MTICLCHCQETYRLVQVITYLSTLSSGLPFFKKRNAFVKWSLRMTASWRNFPINRFFSFISFSNGEIRLSSSLAIRNSSLVDETSSSAFSAFLVNCSVCFWLPSTNSRSSRFLSLVTLVMTYDAHEEH